MPWAQRTVDRFRPKWVIGLERNGRAPSSEIGACRVMVRKESPAPLK